MKVVWLRIIDQSAGFLPNTWLAFNLPFLIQPANKLSCTFIHRLPPCTCCLLRFLALIHLTALRRLALCTKQTISLGTCSSRLYYSSIPIIQSSDTMTRSVAFLALAMTLGFSITTSASRIGRGRGHEGWRNDGGSRRVSSNRGKHDHHGGGVSVLTYRGRVATSRCVKPTRVFDCST